MYTNTKVYYNSLATLKVQEAKLMIFKEMQKVLLKVD